MRITLNKGEYRALDRLRGLPADAHLLVMCAAFTTTGCVLDGSEDAFDELVGFIGEELGEGMAPTGDRRALFSICLKISPGSLEWLGE